MLNDTKIKQLKPKDKPYRVADQGGLCIEVRISGLKFWRFRYRFLGSAKMVTLGEYPIVTLAAARQKALEQKALLDQNIDPSEYKKEAVERAKAQKPISFKEIAYEWFDKRKDSRSEGYRLDVEKSFRLDIFPAFGNKDIKKVNAADVLAMQDSTLKRVKKQKNHGTGESTAIRNRQIVGQVFDYAVATLRRDSNPISSLKGTIEKPPKDGARPMTNEEMAVFHESLNNYKGAETTKNAIKIAIYTMMRSIEVVRLRWDWIDFDEMLITIPPASVEQLKKGQRNIKMNRTHLVPISKQVCDVLKSQYEQTKNGDLVFSSVFDKSKLMNKSTINSALDSMGLKELTCHDFRATASTILHSKKYDSDHIELQLAHVDKNTIRGTYNHSQYLDERRKMLQDWADIVDSWVS
ncbi:tyrosine-type recombinase/integrase [Acinetobacter ursingii]|uniref:tyrosine-type recombinase/integrase n=1 Tax=Acinetobacter ursingii TaxID=108980 RepID=UPI00124FE76C|nr:tyrosine-type recombinase/integrase [Acinetobacter ursingii]